MTHRHRILFTSYASPLAPFSGFSYRALGVLKWLLDRFSVDLIFVGSDKDLRASFIPLERFGQIEVVPANDSFLRKMLGVVGRLPYHHVLFCSPAMRDSLRSLTQENAYDLIWMNKSVHFPALEGLKSLPPVVLDQHAAEPCVWKNLIENDPRGYAKLFFRWNKRKTLKYDAGVYKRAAGVVCISESDQAVTQHYYPGTKTVYVPQGFDPTYYIPCQHAEPDPSLLLFSGTGAVRNVQAIKTLAHAVMPHVHRRCRDMRLLWVGNVERTRDSILNQPWLEITGFVESVPPFFDRGMIYVAPFDMGEGMKTKIIEAMAMGKVVVSTPVGVHGINVRELPFVRVCSDYTSFADAIIEFMENPNLSELGRAARDYALTHYTWDRVLEPLHSFLKECMKM